MADGKLPTPSRSARQAPEAVNEIEQGAIAGREFAEAVIRTARDPFLILDAGLHIEMANDAFYKTFKVSQTESVGRPVFEIDGGSWDIPELRQLLEDILPRNSFFDDFEVTHDFKNIGERTMLLNGRRLELRNNSRAMILLAIEDVTGRRRVSDATTRLAAIIQTLDDAIITHTLEGLITSWNPGAEKMFAYSAKEVIGKNISTLIPPTHEASWKLLSEKVRCGESVTGHETERVRKDGSLVSVSLSVSPLLDDAGQLIGVSVIKRDITERKEASERLRRSEIRFRRLFEAAHDGVLILDSVTRQITEANPFMTSLLGYSREELLGKELWQIGLLKDEQSSQEIFDELHEKGQIRYEDLPLQTKFGQRREVEIVANRYEEDGQSVIQCNIRDISERREVEETLRAARDVLANHAVELERLVTERTVTLRETVAELEAFSYSVSHDMRAPLRAMQGFSHKLLAEHSAFLNPTAVDYLNRIARSSTRLDRLIQDVLSYTKILRAHAPLEPVDLDTLVRDIIHTCEDCQPPKADVLVQGSLPIILGNQAWTTQCFSNLMSNALKFVAPGVVPCVKVRAETIGDFARIWIEDNGLGIDPQDQDRVFRMFERIHPTTEYEGTGIGLTIVRKAVSRMGGTIGFLSELGKGSKFWIQLKKG